MGSQWAHSTCLCTPKSPKVSLKRHIFDPFSNDYWSQNSPFSRLFVTLEGPKWLAIGSKWAHFNCLGTPSGRGSVLEKHIFDPYLTHFWSPNNPSSRHFVTLEGPKWLAMGSKWAHFNCLGTPNGEGSVLVKHIFDPYLTHFLSQTTAFWDFRRAKTGHHELKTRQKHLFWHSMWSRIIFEKNLFFAPGGPCWPIGAPTSLGYLLPITSPCPPSKHTITLNLTPIFAASRFGHASHVD